MKPIIVTGRHLVIAVMQIAVITATFSAALLVSGQHKSSGPTWEDVVHESVAAAQNSASTR